MTDEEYVFRQTSRERKRIGIGTYNKKRRGGKYVRLPSDNLSKSEKRKMNGGVKVYNFAKPMSWEEFKLAPNDIKKMYIDTLMEKFDGVPGGVIAESFGVNVSKFNGYICRHGINLNRGLGKRCYASKFFDSEAGEAWKRWVSGESVKTKEIVDHEENLVADESVEIERVGDAAKLHSLIDALIGTGARVTIEFVL